MMHSSDKVDLDQVSQRTGAEAKTELYRVIAMQAELPAPKKGGRS
jgi:predicted DNA-binding transcriptional regulator AlpA